MKLSLATTFASLFCLCCSLSFAAPISADGAKPRPLQPHEIALLARAATTGAARILVTLDTAVDTTGISPLTERGRRATIAASQADFRGKMAGFNMTVRRAYDAFPIVLVDLDAPALQRLLALDLVRGVQEDHALQPLDNATNNVIHTSVAWANGYQGFGQTIAVLDTGVQDTHPFLTSNGSASRVIGSLSGCFSGDGAASNGSLYSNCPGGVASATGSLVDGEPCYNYPGYSGCEHGTHIAGIAAGNGFYVGGNSQGGVAPAASIMAVQVYTCYWTGVTCIETAYDADVIAALNWVNTEWVESPYVISSVVVSAGKAGIDYTTNCDVLASAYKTAIDTLRNSDYISTVIATGNDEYTDGVDYPACVSSALTVASTNNSDSVSAFSDAANFISLYAPGESVYSSIPPNAYTNLSGTSMAAAQVAGALALMAQANAHTYSVSRTLNILQKTGKPIAANGYTISRINIGAAYDVIFLDGFGG